MYDIPKIASIPGLLFEKTLLEKAFKQLGFEETGASGLEKTYSNLY